jgi:hypothetical protein
MKTLRIIATLLLIAVNFIPALTQAQYSQSLGATFVVTHTTVLSSKYAYTSDYVEREGSVTDFSGAYAMPYSYDGIVSLMTEEVHKNIEFLIAYKNYIIAFDFENAGNKFEGFSDLSQYFKDRKIAVPYLMDLMYSDSGQRLTGKVLIIDTDNIFDRNAENKLGKVNEVDLSKVEIKKDDFMALFGFAPWGLTTGLQIRNSALQSVLSSIDWQKK